MSPHDFLDGDDPHDEADAEPARRPSRRARKRQRRTERHTAKAEARSAYRAKVRDARQAPRSPLALLIVGVVFFGAIIVAGSIAGGQSASAPATHSPSPSKSNSEKPTRTSSSSTPTAPPTTPATSAATIATQTTASKWLIAYFAGENWQQYAAPDATAALTATRGTFFTGSFLQGDTVRIQEYTWRNVSTEGGVWTGTVDVLLDPGRTVPLVASLKVTMSDAGTPQITSVNTLYYGEGQD